MPDWFYRTVAQRVLFCLPGNAGRAVALGVIGTLGKSGTGRAIIDFLGHMEADPRLAVRVAGTDFPSPIGLGWRVDPERCATRALERFGVGGIEILADACQNVVRGNDRQLYDGTRQAVVMPVPEGIARPLLRRLTGADGRERLLLPSGENLPVLAWDEEPSDAVERGKGVVLQVGTKQSATGWRVPATMPVELPAQVRAWRARLAEGAALVLAGGVANPRDAVTLREAGANFILVDAGLVFHGPGLVKRCNEALLSQMAPSHDRKPVDEETSARRSWFWSCALGTALAAGGALTLGLALTRVLLPYDEHYLDLTADTLRRNSPRLFAFMAHDRGTLAGTMLGLGALYLMLGWHGIRRSVHGAKTAVLASALTGFSSFFAFFGFGYFDTLHAFVAAVLMQLTVQIMVSRPGGAPAQEHVVDDENAIWRYAQWGQLFWIIHATGLLIAGSVILGIGMTSVFVTEDLDYLCLTGTQAQALGSRMMGVIAHDRATLGGMLLASGVAMLLPMLWCYRKGAAWLWLAMIGLGFPAYAAALGVHLWVGYTDWRHIVPALLGLSLWFGGVLLSRDYLMGTPRNDPISPP